jgi:hypothetical protein
MSRRTIGSRYLELVSRREILLLLVILAILGVVLISRYRGSSTRRVTLAELQRTTKVQHPESQKTAEWASHWEHDPLTPRQAIKTAAALPRELPVVRRDTSPEPKLLLLSSDGEWTNEELGRLDDVLDTWLEAECPERKQNQDKPPDHRPWLRSDPEKSAEDRKTILIRAGNFKNTWCESLGRRLAKEFPFLWELEVGEEPGAKSLAEWDETYIAVPQNTITMDDGSKVAVEPFEIARYPVSFEQFFRFVTATGYVTTAEKQKFWKNFLDPRGDGEPIAEPDRTLPVSYVSYQDAIAYCQWAGVRLPTEMEYLAAMILDDQVYPRGNPDASQLQEELFLSPQALRGNWLNFTSTGTGDGRIVYRYGPLMLRYEGMRLMDPHSRMATASDSYTEGIALRVCKVKSERR